MFWFIELNANHLIIEHAVLPMYDTLSARLDGSLIPTQAHHRLLNRWMTDIKVI